MNKITKLEDFALFVPKLKELHQRLDGRWEIELNPEQFGDKLLQNFRPVNAFYGEIINGELAYFIAVLNGEFPKVVFWLLYINVKYRDKSRYYVKQILDTSKLEGYKEVIFCTSNISSSYRRWVSKFGAKPSSINYKIIL